MLFLGSFILKLTRMGAIWSLKAAKPEHAMSDEQLALREYIIYNQCIRDDIDLLIINASYETSINIRQDENNPKTRIDYIIVNTSNEDTITQVRGRYRDRLDTLYIHSREIARDGIRLTVPNEYLNGWLTAEECKQLSLLFNIVVGKGRKAMWPTIQQMLIDVGYKIERPNNKAGKIKGKVVYKIIDTTN